MDESYSLYSYPAQLTFKVKRCLLTMLSHVNLVLLEKQKKKKKKIQKQGFKKNLKQRLQKISLALHLYKIGGLQD